MAGYVYGYTDRSMYSLVAFYEINVLKSHNWEYEELYFQIATFLHFKGHIKDLQCI